MEKQKRMIYIDVLNILAIIAVIALHHNGLAHYYDTSSAWKASLIVEVICYWAVPVFLMITGATLMEYRKKYDTKTFFQKRWKKVIFPFLIWSVIMVFWRNGRGNFVIQDYSVRAILTYILNYQPEFTYYFGFIIIGIYLTLPLLSNLAEEKYKKSLWYTVAVYLIFNSLLPMICGFGGIVYNRSLGIQIGGYLIFPILGYLLSTEDIEPKKRYIIYFLGIFCIWYRWKMTYGLSIQRGCMAKDFTNYTQFYSIFPACAVFLAVKNIKWDKLKNQKIEKGLAKIASCSFGIYLIHQIVMYYEMILFQLNMHDWQWRTICIASTYLITLGIVLVLKRIPIIKRIVP